MSKTYSSTKLMICFQITMQMYDRLANPLFVFQKTVLINIPIVIWIAFKSVIYDIITISHNILGI